MNSEFYLKIIGCVVFTPFIMFMVYVALWGVEFICDFIERLALLKRLRKITWDRRIR
jgi:hypothetical protein